MKYQTIVIRYDQGEKREPVELDDSLLGGQVTAILPYDAARISNIAVNAVEDPEVLQQINDTIRGHR